MTDEPRERHAAGAPDGREDDRARRRRLRARIAAVAAALLLVVGLPGYLASRPSFFSRYPALEGRYKPWSVSSHAEAGCEACHISPGLLARSGYRARMTGEFYVSLFWRTRVPDVFGQPKDDACLVCHSDLRTVSPKGDLRIPHRAHVSILKVRCVVCHRYLVHELSPEGRHTPTMAGCLTCHDGDKAKNACSACHTEKAAPDSHRRAGWLIEHGSTAADAKCQGCHKWAKDWCADCHRQRPRSHGKDWREAHGAAVAKHRGCEACHAGPFCVTCHGEVPSRNLNPALSLVK